MLIKPDRQISYFKNTFENWSSDFSDVCISGLDNIIEMYCCGINILWDDADLESFESVKDAWLEIPSSALFWIALRAEDSTKKIQNPSPFKKVPLEVNFRNSEDILNLVNVLESANDTLPAKIQTRYIIFIFVTHADFTTRYFNIPGS